MASIIVNADDLGRSVGINDGIFEAHRRGLVTSATLMVGFAAAARVKAEMGRHGFELSTFPSDELFMGRGGAHCMTCPLLVR